METIEKKIEDKNKPEDFELHFQDFKQIELDEEVNQIEFSSISPAEFHSLLKVPIPRKHQDHPNNEQGGETGVQEGSESAQKRVKEYSDCLMTFDSNKTLRIYRVVKNQSGDSNPIQFSQKIKLELPDPKQILKSSKATITQKGSKIFIPETLNHRSAVEVFTADLRHLDLKSGTLKVRKLCSLSPFYGSKMTSTLKMVEVFENFCSLKNSFVYSSPEGPFQLASYPSKSSSYGEELKVLFKFLVKPTKTQSAAYHRENAGEVQFDAVSEKVIFFCKKNHFFSDKSLPEFSVINFRSGSVMSFFLFNFRTKKILRKAFLSRLEVFEFLSKKKPMFARSNTFAEFNAFFVDLRANCLHAEFRSLWTGYTRFKISNFFGPESNRIFELFERGGDYSLLTQMANQDVYYLVVNSPNFLKIDNLSTGEKWEIGTRDWQNLTRLRQAAFIGDPNNLLTIKSANHIFSVDLDRSKIVGSTQFSFSTMVKPEKPKSHDYYAVGQKTLVEVYKFGKGRIEVVKEINLNKLLGSNVQHTEVINLQKLREDKIQILVKIGALAGQENSTIDLDQQLQSLGEGGGVGKGVSVPQWRVDQHDHRIQQRNVLVINLNPETREVVGYKILQFLDHAFSNAEEFDEKYDRSSGCWIFQSLSNLRKDLMALVVNSETFHPVCRVKVSFERSVRAISTRIDRDQENEEKLKLLFYTAEEGQKIDAPFARRYFLNLYSTEAPKRTPEEIENEGNNLDENQPIKPILVRKHHLRGVLDKFDFDFSSYESGVITIDYVRRDEESPMVYLMDKDLTIKRRIKLSGLDGKLRWKVINNRYVLIGRYPNVRSPYYSNYLLDTKDVNCKRLTFYEWRRKILEDIYMSTESCVAVRMGQQGESMYSLNLRDSE